MTYRVARRSATGRFISLRNHPNRKSISLLIMKWCRLLWMRLVITNKMNKYERFKMALAANRSYSSATHKKPKKMRLPPKDLPKAEP